MTTDRAAPGDAAAAIAPLLADCYRAIFDSVELPDVAVYRSPNLVSGRTAVAIPDFNRIMVRTVDGDPSEAEIDVMLADLGAVPAQSCWLPPGPHQAGIAARFSSRGFKGGEDEGEEHEGDEHPGVPTMWVPTADLPAQRLPSGVTIERVDSEEAADVLTHVTVEGFGGSSRFEAPMADLFRPAAVNQTAPMRMFLARLDSRPVATAIGVVSGVAVGLYSVATLPDARGRGIGSAVTLAAALDGRDRGATIAVLESSEMGFPVYRRLGFSVAARYRVLTRTA